MLDKTTDLTNTEQMVFCLSHVDEVHEGVIGLYSLESTSESADSVVFTIKDVLLRLSLRLDIMCRGQCYDGASTMSGSRSGVSTQIAGIEPRALYTNCYGHALNFATQDAIKGVKLMADTLETIYETTKLIKKSPKFQGYYNRICILCPTRWTVRAEALASIADILQLTWDMLLKMLQKTVK
jgi:hypothetical protein